MTTAAIAEIESQIEKQEQHGEALREALKYVNDKIRELRLAKAREVYGVEVGAIVVDSKGNQYRVTSIVPDNWEKPWIKGNPRKVSGEFGILERHLYDDWEVVPQ